MKQQGRKSTGSQSVAVTARDTWNDLTNKDYEMIGHLWTCAKDVAVKVILQTKQLQQSETLPFVLQGAFLHMLSLTSSF